PLVLGERRVNQFAAQRLKPRQRAFLVGADQPAVSRDIRRKNGRQSTFDAFGRQEAPRMAGGSAAPALVSSRGYRTREAGLRPSSIAVMLPARLPPRPTGDPRP